MPVPGLGTGQTGRRSPISGRVPARATRCPPLMAASFCSVGPRHRLKRPLCGGDTWAWLDQSWRQIQDIGPAPRQRHAMAYDPTGAIVLFGGETAAGAFGGDTW